MFSLNWFTTIPGLLITGGVLLLVIALIIFIVTSRKEKKNGGVNSNNINTNAPSNSNEAVNQTVAVQPAFEQQPIGINAAPVQGGQSSMVDSTSVIAPTVMSTSISDNFSNPSINVPMDNLSAGQSLNNPSQGEGMANVPIVDPLSVSTQEVDKENIGASTPVADVSSGFISNPSIPEVQSTMINSPTDAFSQEIVPAPVPVPTISEVPPDSSTNSTVNVSEVVAPSVEQVVPELQDVAAPSISTVDTYTSPYNSDNLQSVPNNAPIYGGANPNVSDIVVNPVSPQIYGGANPLDGTQSIPVTPSNNEVTSQQVSPDLNPTPVVNISAPVVEQPTVTPVSVDPVPNSNVTVNPIPTVETPVSSYVTQQPVVSNEPVVNPINNNFTYQSATAPQIQIPTDGNIQ